MPPRVVADLTSVRLSLHQVKTAQPGRAPSLSFYAERIVDPSPHIWNPPKSETPWRRVDAVSIIHADG